MNRLSRSTWDQLKAGPSASPDQILLQTSLSFYSSLDTPKSLACWLLLKNQEWKQLVEMGWSPHHYADADLASLDYAAVGWLKKFDKADNGIDKEGAAKESFFKAERLCQLTNERFLNLADQPGWVGDLAPIFHGAARKISAWLGDFSSEDWLEACRFGPGSDYLNKGWNATIADKLTRTPSASGAVYSAAPVLLAEFPAWHRALLGLAEEGSCSPILPAPVKEVVGNRVEFVPKNGKTYRSIAIEPTLNIFLQLGIGSMIRSRLRRVGIDLKDQTINQKLARVGSIDDSLSTLDLSMASDTVALNLVKNLVRCDWLKALLFCRSEKGVLDGTEIVYEKFSSMGNGYTFELETLLFAALIESCADACDVPIYWGVNASVYGDDIICPSQVSNLLIRALQFGGFSLNMEKSFVSGPFRESCGRDYWSGRNIRPFFLKKELVNYEELFKTANGIRLLASRRLNYQACDSRFRSAYVSVVQKIPKDLRFFGPAKTAEQSQGLSQVAGEWSIETGYLVENFDFARPATAYSSKLQRVSFVISALSRKYLNRKLTRREAIPVALYAYARRETRTDGFHPTLESTERWLERPEISRMLLNAEANQASLSEGLTPRQDKWTTKVRRVTLDAWYDLGPWL